MRLPRKINTAILSSVCQHAQIPEQDLKDSISQVLAVLECSAFLEFVRENYHAGHYQAAVAFCESYAGAFAMTEWSEYQQVVSLRFHSGHSTSGTEIRIGQKYVEYNSLYWDNYGDMQRGLIRREII